MGSEGFSSPSDSMVTMGAMLTSLLVEKTLWSMQVWSDLAGEVPRLVSKEVAGPSLRQEQKFLG